MLLKYLGTLNFFEFENDLSKISCSDASCVRWSLSENSAGCKKYFCRWNWPKFGLKNPAIIKQFLSYGSDGFEMVFMNLSVFMK